MAALSGIRVQVKLTPRASRETIEGVAFDAGGRTIIKARVTAPPVDGKANAALIALLAKTLGVPKRDVSLSGGESSRMKTVFIAGDAGALRNALARLAEHAR